MFKRFYLTLLVAVLLSVGGVSAYAATDADSQKEKDKQEQGKQKEGAKAEEKAVAEAFSLPVIMGSGSYLGVFLDDVTPEQVKSLGLSEERGARIFKVVEGGPAEKAGLKENDVIISFNNRPIESVRELQRLLSEIPEGRTVSIEVIRNGARQTVSAALAKRSARFGGLRGELNMFQDRERNLFDQSRKRIDELNERIKKSPGEFGTFDFTAPGFFESFRDRRLGASVETLGSQLAEYFGVKDGKGLLVSEVIENSAAAKAGLKAGDVIIAVDGEKVERVRNLLDLIRAKNEGPMTLTVIRNRSEQTITLTLERAEPRAKPMPRRKAVSIRTLAELV